MNEISSPPLNDDIPTSSNGIVNNDTTPSTDGILKDDTALGDETIPLSDETIPNHDAAPDREGIVNDDTIPARTGILINDTALRAETIPNPDEIGKTGSVVSTDDVLSNTTLNNVVSLPLVEGSALKQRYLIKGLQGANNTERAYRADLDDYVKWCKEQELVALPATPAVLGEYVSALASHKRWATISRRLTAIRKWHELHGQESPLSDRWFKATLKGIQREHGTHAQQSPAFAAGKLKQVIRNLETERKGVPRFTQLRDKVVLLLGFMGAFRRSELVALSVEHVQFSEDGVVISYFGSKTNQTGLLEEKAFFYSPDPTICPVRTLKRWVELLERTQGPLLVRVRKGNELTQERLSDQSVNKIVKSYLGKDFSAHSLRASFVTTAKLNGAEDSEIMQQTKHKTTAMIRRYTRLDSIKQHNAAKKLQW